VLQGKGLKEISKELDHSGIARCGYRGKALIGQEAKGGRFNYYVCGTPSLRRRLAPAMPVTSTLISLRDW